MPDMVISLDFLKKLQFALGISVIVVPFMLGTLTLTVNRKIKAMETPRTLTAKQETQITETLRHDAPRMLLQVNYPPGDDEAMAFANKMHHILVQEGWPMAILPASKDWDFKKGLSLEVGPKITDNNFEFFMKVLRENGIEISLQEHRTAQANIGFLLVGPKNQENK